jgi:hypothetical protein
MNDKARVLEKIANSPQMSALIRKAARKELEAELAFEAIWKDVTCELLNVNA